MQVIDSKGLFGWFKRLLGGFPQVFHKFYSVRKDWGQEIWVVNGEKYCLKFMELSPGWQCSLHRHPIKLETFVVVSGEMWVEQERSVAKLLWRKRCLPGGVVTIPTGTWHRFINTGAEPCWFIEVSTHHDDNDVERREMSRAIKDYTKQLG